IGKSRRSARVASTPLLRNASTVSRASLRFTESRRALPARTRILGGCVACMIYLAFKIYDVERLLSDAKGATRRPVSLKPEGGVATVPWSPTWGPRAPSLSRWQLSPGIGKRSATRQDRLRLAFRVRRL